MRGEFIGAIGVAAQVVPVGHAFGEQHVHHRAGERAVGARSHRQMQIGLLGGAGAIWVDHHQLGAPLLGGHGVLHHVDLGVHRIAAPDHDQFGVLGRFQQIDAALAAHACDPASIRQRHADGREPARILHHVAQPVDAVALYQPHGAGVVIRPHRFGAVTRGRVRESLGDAIERFAPADGLELAAALRTVAQEWLREPAGVVHTLGVARDLFADHAAGVGMALRTTHTPDGARVDQFDLQRAGAGAIVRTDRGSEAKRGIHRRGPIRMANRWLR